MGSSLGELIVKIETDLTNFNNGLREANVNMQKRSGEIIKGTQQIGKAFTAMGLVIVGTFGLAAKAAISFEDSFAGVRKTVDLTEEGFSRLRQNLRDLSKEIPLSVNALANIGEVVGQLGVTGVDNITKFTETIAKLGLTTNIIGEQGALQLSRFINIIGESTGNVDRLGAVLVELGNKFAAREAEILDLSLSLASFGQQIRLTSPQVIAFATVIKASGGIAQAAGTAFQKVALTLKDAVITGGSELRIFADIAGVSVAKLRKIFKEDAAEALVLFLEGLKRIDEEGGSVKKALEDLGLADQRLVREFGKVISNTDQLREALDLAKKAFEENTALTEEFEKKVKTVGSQLKLLFNIVSDVGIALGDILLPRIKSIIDFIKPMIERITKWIEENKKLADIIIMVTLAIGGLMLALGPLLILLPSIMAGITLITTAISTGLLVALGKVALVAGAAFAGWKLGEVISDVLHLKELLNGPDGLLTKMIPFLNTIADKLQVVKNMFASWIAMIELAKGMIFGFEETPEVDLGQITVGGEGEEEKSPIATPTEEDRNAFFVFFEGIKGDFKAALDHARNQLLTFQDLLKNVFVTFQKGFGKAVSNVVLGITSAKEAAKQLGQQLIAMVIEFFAEWVAHQLLAKALTTALSAFTIATAATIAAAWAPAAALASLATLGGNAAPAQAALTSTTALAQVLAIPPMAEGGIVRKPTIALVGEAGPEAVIPLDKAPMGNQVTIQAPIEINVGGNLDQETADNLAELIGENLEEKLRRVFI